MLTKKQMNEKQTNEIKTKQCKFKIKLIDPNKTKVS